MTKRLLYSVTLLLLSVIAPSRSYAQLIFNINPGEVTVRTGSSVSVYGSLKNDGMETLKFNNINSGMSDPGFTIDDSGFSLYELGAGDEWSGEVLQLVVGTGVWPGEYSGTVLIRGGVDSSQFENLAIGEFKVHVVEGSVVPEPAALTLLVSSISALGLFLGYRKWSHIKRAHLRR